MNKNLTDITVVLDRSGENQDAFAEASSLGISKVSTMTYSPSKTDTIFYAASRNVGSMRGMAAKGMSATNSYTAEESESVT